MTRALVAIASLFAPVVACATPPELTSLTPGQPAPAFTLPNVDGAPVSLADFRGKTVVLEWFNPGCPYVVYAHGEGPLRDQAARSVNDQVVWLAINSSGPGLQGHGVEANRAAASTWSMGHPILLDESGAVGKQYGARTTPQMVVVKPDGTVGYVGALDNAPRGTLQGTSPVNYVDAALADLAAGRPVATPQTQSYGCSVKYAPAS